MGRNTMNTFLLQVACWNFLSPVYRWQYDSDIWVCTSETTVPWASSANTRTRVEACVAPAQGEAQNQRKAPQSTPRPFKARDGAEARTRLEIPSLIFSTLILSKNTNPSKLTFTWLNAEGSWEILRAPKLLQSDVSNWLISGPTRV